MCVCQHFQTASPLNPLGQLKPNFTWNLHGMGEPKYAQMGQVTWPMWLPCSYIVKTLTNLLLRKKKADDLQTWYCQVCSTDGHGLTLTFLTARSCLVPYAFVKQLIFQKQLQSMISKSVDEYINLYELQRSRLLTLVQGHSDSIFYKLFMEPSWGVGKICSNVPGHMTMPIYGEKLQKSSSEPRGRWPWNLVYSIGYSSTTIFFKRWPWVKYKMYKTIFMTGSKLFPNAFAWVKACTALWANVFPSLF